MATTPVPSQDQLVARWFFHVSADVFVRMCFAVFLFLAGLSNAMFPDLQPNDHDPVAFSLFAALGFECLAVHSIGVVTVDLRFCIAAALDAAAEIDALPNSEPKLASYLSDSSAAAVCFLRMFLPATPMASHGYRLILHDYERFGQHSGFDLGYETSCDLVTQFVPRDLPFTAVAFGLRYVSGPLAVS